MYHRDTISAGKSRDGNVNENAIQSLKGAMSERYQKLIPLKMVPPDTADYVICRRHHLLSNIRKDLARFDPIFDAMTFEELKSSLAALAESSTQAARTQHAEETQKVASGNVCPWCGSELVRRNGKYGPFMGCSSYPKCRFTRDA